MRKYCTRTKGRVRTRYLKCDRCTNTDVEKFHVDHLGRQVFVTSFTPPDKDTLDQALAARTIKEST